MRVVIPSHVATFVGSGEMAGAYVIARAPKGALPVQSGGELAMPFGVSGELVGTRKAFSGASETWSE